MIGIWLYESGTHSLKSMKQWSLLRSLATGCAIPPYNQCMKQYPIYSHHLSNYIIRYLVETETNCVTLEWRNQFEIWVVNNHPHAYYTYIKVLHLYNESCIHQEWVDHTGTFAWLLASNFSCKQAATFRRALFCFTYSFFYLFPLFACRMQHRLTLRAALEMREVAVHEIINISDVDGWIWTCDWFAVEMGSRVCVCNVPELGAVAGT